MEVHCCGCTIETRREDGRAESTAYVPVVACCEPEEFELAAPDIVAVAETAADDVDRTGAKIKKRVKTKLDCGGEDIDRRIGSEPIAEDDLSFVNLIVEQLWPWVEPAVVRHIETDVVPKVKSQMPKSLVAKGVSIDFREISIGQNPPKFDPKLKTFSLDPGIDEAPAMSFEVGMKWECDCNVVLAVRGPLLKLDIIIKSFAVDGCLSILIPGMLARELPVLTAVAVYFPQKPVVWLNFEISAGNWVKELGWVKDLIQSTINQTLREMCVLPNRIVIKPKYKNMEVVRAFDFHAIQFPVPIGVLRVRVVSAFVLAGDMGMKDILGGSRSHSDPYCKVYFGSACFQTGTVNNTVTPVWDHHAATVDFPVYSQRQCLYLEVFDDDMSYDEILGYTQIVDLKEMLSHRGESFNLDLDISSVREALLGMQKKKGEKYWVELQCQLFVLSKEKPKRPPVLRPEMLVDVVNHNGKPQHATSGTIACDSKVSQRVAYLCVDVHGARGVSAEDAKGSVILCEVGSRRGVEFLLKSDKAKFLDPLHQLANKDKLSKEHLDDHLINLVANICADRRYSVDDATVAKFSDLSQSDVDTMLWESRSVFPVVWKSAMFHVPLSIPDGVTVTLTWKSRPSKIANPRVFGSVTFEIKDLLMLPHTRKHTTLVLNSSGGAEAGGGASSMSGTKRALAELARFRRGVSLGLAAAGKMRRGPEARKGAGKEKRDEDGDEDPGESSGDEEHEQHRGVGPKPLELDVVSRILWMCRQAGDTSEEPPSIAGSRFGVPT